jgi:hypothetical protein
MHICSKVQIESSTEKECHLAPPSLFGDSGQRVMDREKENKIWFHFMFCDLEQSSNLSVPSFLLCEIKNWDYMIHKHFTWFSESWLLKSPPFVILYSRFHRTQDNTSDIKVMSINAIESLNFISAVIILIWRRKTFIFTVI